jgi:nitrate/TMAO reductase-like tetraheme cytochrome c subunit
LKYLILFFIAFTVAGLSQISPGDLTKAHAAFEGLSNCTKCHEIGERVKNNNCLSCHTEVDELIKQKKGYHSSSDVKGKNCADCHSEHHGRNFRIVNFNPDNFDHSKTTFTLSGKHSRIKCTECHNSKNIVNPGALKKNANWMGLNNTCSSCHTDYHQGTLGNNCGNCHNTEKFRPSLFDHAKTRFALSGAHIKTDCIKCHPKSLKEGKEFQKFKDISFNSCENCHKDPHSGKLGKNCSSCHSTNSFKAINQKAFDHSKTDFPLIGKHLTVSCSSCHKINLTDNIKHEYCNDCHKDFHNGEFVVNGKTKTCNQCHNEYGFSPSLFSISNHSETEFPLAGSHLAVPCGSCHLKEEKWKFKSIGKNCEDCHRNVHGNEISQEYFAGSGCRNCHSINSWHTIKFDHSKTDFPLSGKHAQAECRSCHITANNNHRFASLNSYCTGCHEDVHASQFGSGKSEECSRCHSFDNWKPEKFDHNKTRFSLEGAHSKLQCSECHKKITSGTVTFIKYKLEDFKCASCHS